MDVALLLAADPTLLQAIRRELLAEAAALEQQARAKRTLAAELARRCEEGKPVNIAANRI